MKRGKKDAPWWVYALTAVIWALGSGVWFHMERLDGLDVVVALLFLANAVVWAVRAACAVRGQSAAD